MTEAGVDQVNGALCIVVRYREEVDGAWASVCGGGGGHGPVILGWPEINRNNSELI
jgi:hypothetical protein